jgi:hypothetical protein
MLGESLLALFLQLGDLSGDAFDFCAGFWGASFEPMITQIIFDYL